MLSTMIAIGASALANASQAPAHHYRRAHEGTTIESPTWSRAPSFADVAAAYPARAHGVDGSATLYCRVAASGALEACEVTSETPGGLGFGEAAKSLAAKFTVSVDPSWPTTNERYGVEVPVRLTSPDKLEMRDRLISRPTWMTKFSPTAVASFFPSEAASKGMTTGRGVAECKVQPDGALASCRPVSAEPEGAGFSEAAARAASGMRMNPWTRDGGPVDGAVVLVPIRLTVDDSPADIAPDHVAWAETPSGSDVLSVFPRLALARSVGGQVDMRCRVQSSGALSHCDVLSESPTGWGFGSAAQQLAPKYRVSMSGSGHPEPGSWIRVSVPIETMSH
jgi:protein TonB